jgi:RNA-directed DNA polymerase
VQEGGTVTDRTREAAPAGVPEGATQAGEIRARWAWVEPTVWTDRMLTALETGVKGGRWFSLVDKVYALPTLRAAFAKVKANDGAAGVDHQSVAMYEQRLDANLATLSQSLREGTYRPQGIRRQWIDKLGSVDKRPLGIPTVRDRIVQAAVRLVLEPIFEQGFAPHSYGFRPQRGAKDALRRVNALLEAGQVFVVDADLQTYFDSIPQAPLRERVQTKISDGRLLALIDAFLDQEIFEGLDHWTPSAGTPQGAVISPLLANIYLDPLDHHMAAAGFEMVRYADDFVVLCTTETEAQRALSELHRWTAAAGLQLHPRKTRVVNARQPGGFDFLGYHFERGYRWPREKSVRKVKDTLRRKTRRTRGQSLAVIIADVNRTLVGWFAYFKHSHHTTFGPVDGWVRMRLRSLLRKRHGRRGRAQGLDHQRWPNAFFTEQGLFSLVAARATAVGPR